MQGPLSMLYFGLLLSCLIVLSTKAHTLLYILNVEDTALNVAAPEKLETIGHLKIRDQAIVIPKKGNEATSKKTGYSENEKLALRLLGRDVIERLGLLRTEQLYHHRGMFSSRN